MLISGEDTLKLLARNVKSQIESPQDEHRQVENTAMSYKQCSV